MANANTSTSFLWGGSHQYQTDYESGLYLLGNRYYDPAIGRFISQDPAQDESNWYSYCGNNPLVATDPSGLEKVSLVQSEGGPAGLTGNHVVIKIEWHDEKGVLHTCYYSFYPGKTEEKRPTTGPGAVLDEHTKPSGRESTSVTITKAQVRTLKGSILGPHPKYNAEKYNCADWARDRLSSIMPGFTRTQAVETPKSLFNHFNGGAEGPEGQ